MEASERQKLTTKDMALGDKKEFEHFNQDPRSRAETEAAVGVPSDLNRINGEALNPLLLTNEGDRFRSRWQNIQTSFVDEPRRAVEQADELVAEIMQRLAQSFSDQRSRLESEWERSEKVSTEELRVALRSYRSFFHRLLSV
ncbi:MAG: hypothetical protein ABIP88_13445 [Candidatus Binatia bacterium]